MALDYLYFSVSSPSLGLSIDVVFVCVILLLHTLQLGAKLAREQTAKDDLQQRVTLAESELQIQLERVRAADSELDDLRRKLDGSHLLEVFVLRSSV